jgi:hypothetical protein
MFDPPTANHSRRTYPEGISVNSKRNCLLLWTIIAGVLLTSLTARAQTSCTTSTPGAPCFTDVYDYLNGLRNILSDDDLLYLTNRDSTNDNAALQKLLSNDLKFTASQQLITPALGCLLLRGPEAARLFNTTNDWVAVIKGNTNEPMCGHSVDLVWEDPQNPSTLQSMTIPEDVPNSIEIAAVDVNQDGYADLLVYDTATIRIFTAVDVNDSTKGLKLVATVSFPGGNGKGKLAVGDFNRDGAIDIIVPEQRLELIPGRIIARINYWEMYGFSVCPAAGYTILSGSTDPKYPPYNCKAEWDIYYPNGTGKILGRAFGNAQACACNGLNNIGGYSYSYIAAFPPRLVSGDFLGLQTGQSELFADLDQKVYETNPLATTFWRTFELWKFDAALIPTLVSTVGPTKDGFLNNGHLVRSDFLRSAKIHWSGAGSDRDQVILYADNDNEGASGHLKILTIDNSGKITTSGQTDIPTNGVSTVKGMDVGRFDPPKVGDNDNFDKQIAVLLTPISPYFTALCTESIDQNWTFSQGCQTLGPARTYAGYGAFDNLEGMMRSVDAQGRSVLLGTPLRLVIEDHMQPNLVLDIPPMHIDYIKDAAGKGPQVMNFTVMPPATSGPSFSTQYTFDSISKAAQDNTSKTDVSNSVGGSIEASVYFGAAKKKDANFSITSLTAAKGSWTNSSTTKDTSYETVQKTTNATTGFADHIYFRTSRLNVYLYPIIGKVCPASIPNCSNSEKIQQYFQYSAPDEIEDADLDGTTQEWYQPVQEPGNVFSYPWDLEQMTKLNPNLVKLSGPNTWNDTDTATESILTKWQSGSSTGKTTGAVSKWSVDESLTESGNVGFGIGGAGGGFEVTAKVDYGHSDSLETQNTFTTSLDATTGIQVNTPGFSQDVANRYFYYYTNYILGADGEEAPSLTEPEVTAPGGEPVQQQFFGPLVVAYAADPFHFSSVAPWWRQAYTKPDIGLNHPARWNWDKNTKTASFNYHEPITIPPDPKTILNDLFYHMKGFYIGKASDDPDSSPNLSVANTGDVLRLQVRVYNFSVADMPSGSVVHVRFYGQAYDAAAASLKGDGFFIGEDVIGPIPGFNSVNLGDRGTLPNWKMASTLFDTTNYSGEFLVFWVVAWGEDSSGNLLAEQEGHGLTQNPSDLGIAQITDVPVEDYSNNVGMYDTYDPFFVIPKTNNATGTQAVHGDVTELGANDVLVEATPVTGTKDRSVITVTIHNNTRGHLSSEPVVFYDGDPADGAKPFDFQRIPYLEKDGTYALRTFLRPETSGNHNIYVRVGWKGHAAPNLALTTLAVP